MESDGTMKTIRILKDSRIENRLYRDSDQIRMPTSTEEIKRNYWISTSPITYRKITDQQ